MLDFDKLPAPLQWFLFGIGAIGAFFAARSGKRDADVPETDSRVQAREDERVRVAVAALNAEAKLRSDVNNDIAKLRADFALDLNAAQTNFTDQLSATRKEFFTKFEQLAATNHQECVGLETRIREVELEIARMSAGRRHPGK